MAEKTKRVFLFLAFYDDANKARADIRTVRELHNKGDIGTYDAALVYKEIDGNVTIEKWEKASQHGAWTGIAAGAAIGVLFPPAIIGSAAVGGVAGGLIGHFWRGLSRADVKELGEMLDEGETLLVVVGHERLSEALENAKLGALKRLEKEVCVDAHEFDAELKRAEAQLKGSGQELAATE